MENKKYLIVGLGNPGDLYQGTRHNLGFLLADKIAQSLKANLNLNSKLKSEIGKAKLGNFECIIIKPQTYMNLSGEAVKLVSEYYEINPQNIIVVCDDTNLQIGAVRCRFGGESGGHNGLKSVIGSIDGEFWRIRIGIGSNGVIPLEDYVLQRFSGEQADIVDNAIDKTADFVINSLTSETLENKTIN